MPAGDTHSRFVCDACETIHYQNPNIVAGCIAEWDDKILLCKRAIEPRHGLWTLPAGFMENNESTEDAARRETLEEAGAQATIISLYSVYSIPHISQVYMFFRATIEGGVFEAGIESLECDLFNESQIPWDQLAFPVVKKTLEHYYADRKDNRGFPIHVGDMIKHPAERTSRD